MDLVAKQNMWEMLLYIASDPINYNVAIVLLTEWLLIIIYSITWSWVIINTCIIIWHQLRIIMLISYDVMLVVVIVELEYRQQHE